MSLFAESVARTRGNEICRTLQLRGYEPLWFKTEASGNNLVVCFQIMSQWRKAVVVASTDTPNDAERELEKWKAELLAELNASEPRPIVQVAIATFGERQVRQALQPRTVH